MKAKSNYSNRRNLTTLGKNTFIKSLLLSCLNQLCVSLPDPDETILEEINAIIIASSGK